jgi:hypothetical protein
MKNLVIMGMASLLVGSPASAQRYGGGMEGSMGGINNAPPTTQIGLSPTDGRNAARDDASQRGQSGQDFAELQKRSPDELKTMAANHRKAAEALATAARAGAPIPSTAKDRIRSALAEDIAAWRFEFRLGRKELQDMRDKWLSDSATTTASEWAIRRADWFAARDVWITKQQSFAMIPNHR